MLRICVIFLVLFQPLICKSKVKDEITLIRVDSSPHNDALKLQTHKITPPFKAKQKISIDSHLFPLGVVLPSEFKNYNLRQSKQGSRILVYVLAKNRVSRFYLDRVNGLNLFEEKSYRSKLYTKTVPKKNLANLKPGPVAFLAVPLTAYNESIKGKNADSLIISSYKKNIDLEAFSHELAKPMVLYNQPIGVYLKGDPILLDFYLLNCTLSRYYGYTLLLELKKTTKKGFIFKGEINHWSSYLLKNLGKGMYTLELTLKYRGKKLGNPLGIPARSTFTVK